MKGKTHSAHLELSREPKTADLAIRSLAALIDTLPKAERKLWDTHGVENPDGELLLLWVVAPPGLEMFFREVASAPGAPPKQREVGQTALNGSPPNNQLHVNGGAPLAAAVQ